MLAVKGIAFDIDGTLYPNRQMFFLSLSSFLGNPRLVYHFSKARKTIRTFDKIDDFRRTQAGIIAGTIKTDPDKIYNLIENRLYGRWEKAFRFLKAYPGLRTLVEDLKRRGFKLGVLSDFPPQKKLVYLGLDGLWDTAFSSEEVHYLKPRPEPFIQLAERMGLDPSEILYIGNNFIYDILGASAVKMKTAYLTSRKNSRKTAPPADIVFSSYYELAELLKPLNP